MSLGIGKFTGILPNGSKVYQKIDEKGTRIITTIKNGTPVREIRIQNYSTSPTDGILGYNADVKDFKTGLTHSFSDITDYGFDEQFRSKVKTVTDDAGNLKQIAVTRSKDGDMFEIARSQRRPNGEEFTLSKSSNKDKDKTYLLSEFETSDFGWTKPDGKKLYGFIQKDADIKDGKFAGGKTYGTIDVMPSINELV